MKSNSRRSFLHKVALGTGSLLIAPLILNQAQAEESRRAKKDPMDLPLAEPGKDMAKALNYASASADPAKTCANCMLFSKPGKKNGEDVGLCSAMAGKLVKASGTCNSWTKKM